VETAQKHQHAACRHFDRRQGYEAPAVSVLRRAKEEPEHTSRGDSRRATFVFHRVLRSGATGGVVGFGVGALMALVIATHRRARPENPRPDGAEAERRALRFTGQAPTAPCPLRAASSGELQSASPTGPSGRPAGPNARCREHTSLMSEARIPVRGATSAARGSPSTRRR